MARTSGRYKLGKDIDLSKSIVRGKNGKRITNTRARVIAESAIESTLGRPSLSGPAQVSPEIKARVPKKVKREITALAKKRKLTVSEVVREALEKYLHSA